MVETMEPGTAFGPLIMAWESHLAADIIIDDSSGTIHMNNCNQRGEEGEELGNVSTAKSTDSGIRPSGSQVLRKARATVQQAASRMADLRWYVRLGEELGLFLAGTLCGFGRLASPHRKESTHVPEHCRLDGTLHSELLEARTPRRAEHHKAPNHISKMVPSYRPRRPTIGQGWAVSLRLLRYDCGRSSPHWSSTPATRARVPGTDVSGTRFTPVKKTIAAIHRRLRRTQALVDAVGPKSGRHRSHHPPPRVSVTHKSIILSRRNH